MRTRYGVAILLLTFLVESVGAQADCPYPIIFHHGWLNDQTAFAGVYNDSDFSHIYGTLTDDHVFHAMNNASFSTYIWGDDGVEGTSDDDVLVTFNNENNVLAPGCVYAINLDNGWNEDTSNPILFPNSGAAIGFTESDSNESAIYKQGYSLSKMIDAVLAANPDKDKVIVVGYSMGGLALREYLQRTEGGSHRWWVDPSSSDGHQIIHATTITTPHLGSNTLGNISIPGPTDKPAERAKDGLPDIFSEAVRDLRYSWSCGFLGFGDCPAAYLYGGEEAAGSGWWNEDVNCDGDDSDTDVVGINIRGDIQGVGDEWDGTYDNPNMPLPTNLRYTWITSDIFGFNGDGVVGWGRQWVRNGSTPYPTDGTSGRLSDTTLTNYTHLGANGDPDVMIRGIDEGDYPAFAWTIEREQTYVSIPTHRAYNAPEGSPTTDPDWFTFMIPSDFADDLAIDVAPAPGVSTTVEYFGGSPASYTSFSTSGSHSATYAQGTTSEQRILIPNAQIDKGNNNYIRITHQGADYTDWRQPAQVTIRSVMVLPLVWGSFELKAESPGASLLTWTTSQEEGVAHFTIERSNDGRDFEMVGVINAKNDVYQQYTFRDQHELTGTLYYRIRSHDYDQQEQVSIVRQVSFTSPTASAKVYPNPTSAGVRVELSTTSAGVVNWLIYDNLGRLQLQGPTHTTAQRYTFSLPAEDLSPGVYWVVLRGVDWQLRIPLQRK